MTTEEIQKQLEKLRSIKLRDLSVMSQIYILEKMLKENKKK